MTTVMSDILKCMCIKMYVCTAHIIVLCIEFLCIWECILEHGAAYRTEDNLCRRRY